MPEPVKMVFSKFHTSLLDNLSLPAPNQGTLTWLISISMRWYLSDANACANVLTDGFCQKYRLVTRWKTYLGNPWMLPGILVMATWPTLLFWALISCTFPKNLRICPATPFRRRQSWEMQWPRLVSEANRSPRTGTTAPIARKSKFYWGTFHPPLLI